MEKRGEGEDNLDILLLLLFFLLFPFFPSLLFLLSLLPLLLRLGRRRRKAMYREGRGRGIHIVLEDSCISLRVKLPFCPSLTIVFPSKSWILEVVYRYTSLGTGTRANFYTGYRYQLSGTGTNYRVPVRRRNFVLCAGTNKRVPEHRRFLSKPSLGCPSPNSVPVRP